MNMGILVDETDKSCLVDDSFGDNNPMGSNGDIIINILLGVSLVDNNP